MKKFKVIRVGGKMNRLVRLQEQTFWLPHISDAYISRIRKYYREIELSIETREVNIVAVTLEELHALNGMPTPQPEEWQDIAIANYLAKLAHLQLLSPQIAAHVHTQTTSKDLKRLGYGFVVCGMDRVLNDFLMSLNKISGSVFRFKGCEPFYYPADYVVRTAKNGGCLLYLKPD